MDEYSDVDVFVEFETVTRDLPELSDDRVEPKDYLDVAEIVANGGEPELATLPDRCRRTLTEAARAAWDKPLPPTRKASPSLAGEARLDRLRTKCPFLTGDREPGSFYIEKVA